MRNRLRSIGIQFTLALLLLSLTANQAPADSSSAESPSAAGAGSPITLIEEGPWQCRVPTATGQTHNAQRFVYIKGTFKHVFELTASSKGFVTGAGKAKMKYIALYQENVPSTFTIRSSGVSDVTIRGLLKEDSEGASAKQMRQSKQGIG